MKKFETSKLKRLIRRSKPAAASSATAIPAILHIDDDPNDTSLLAAAARTAGLKLDLHNVEDGEDAIAYLSGAGRYADRFEFPVPSLVLLDLKMPRATGFEVLRWIREHSDLGHLPVVVLSGSDLQEDVRRAYDVGANSYLIKPIGFEALVTMVSNLSKVWLSALTQAHPA